MLKYNGMYIVLVIRWLLASKLNTKHGSTYTCIYTHGYIQ